MFKITASVNGDSKSFEVETYQELPQPYRDMVELVGDPGVGEHDVYWYSVFIGHLSIESVPTYPRFYRQVDWGHVVFFTGKRQGVVVEAGGGWVPGDYSKEWTPCTDENWVPCTVEFKDAR